MAAILRRHSFCDCKCPPSVGNNRMGLVGRQNTVCLCDKLYHSVTGFVEDPGYTINPLSKERGYLLWATTGAPQR